MANRAFSDPPVRARPRTGEPRFGTAGDRS